VISNGLDWNFTLYLITRFTLFALGRVTAENLERGMKTFAGLRMKLNHFHKLIDGAKNWNTADEDRMPIRPEWTTVDRVLDMRFDTLSFLFSLEFG